MKRLISWLLVLAMAIACLPMSAFAVEIDDTVPDVDVGFEELLPGYAADDRLLITFVMNETNTEGTASVTVPAGKTMYFEYMGDPTYELSVDGVAHVFVAAAGRTDTNKFEIENNTDADKTYALKIALPVGTYNNPKVIEEMNWYSDEVTQTLGDYEGYYYIYTAAETGNVTLYFNAEYDDEGNLIEGNVRDISVTNLNTNANKTLLNDGVDNYGLELVVPVEAGQQLRINTSWIEDAAQNPYPAGTYSWTGNFSYPAGSEQNPITIEWEWNDTYTTATASVNVEADGTYYTGNAGMILTVDGVETEMSETGVFQLTAGEHALVMSTPVGANENPEVINDINDYSDSNSLAANGNYNYIWTATEDGTVTLDVTDGANLVVDKLTYSEDSEWPISTQFELAVPDIDENWNYIGWVVEENLVIDVVAGEQLKIQVNALTDWSTWTTPAIDYTLTGDFEAAEPEVVWNIATSGYGLSLDAELIVSAKFMIPDDLYNDADAVIKVQFIDQVTEYKMSDFTRDSKNRIQIEQSVKSPWMTHLVTVTITDGEGNAADYTDYWGAPFTGSYSFGAENYVKLMSQSNPDVKLVNAVRGLLTYGAYAQAYFSESGTANITEERATAILVKYGYEPLDISGFSKDLLTQRRTGEGDNFDQISIRTESPNLGAAIYMDVQFNANGLTSAADMDNYTYELSYMAGKTEMKKEITPTWDSRGRLKFQILDIPAMYFDAMYSITITKKATGETYTGATSILVYAFDAFDKYATAYPESFFDLLTAMYYYNDAANTYFGK